MIDEPTPPQDLGLVLGRVSDVLLREITFNQNTDYVYILKCQTGLNYLKIRLPDGCVFQCDAGDGTWMDLHSPSGERLHGATLYRPEIYIICALAKAMCSPSIRTKSPLPLQEHEVYELRGMEGWSDDEDLY